ncbi:efflux RND transporter periplasmic adaptor subunit [Pseudooceanicola sp. 502str34]|uniref:efflux RND transporter periplasmic adaptor subunit n=1 Tax=Maritimibacter alkaliphilus TaxID=404236 RepID=UPI001C98226C|nr:efflux RND transporter periplasmic adaptor subunit [Maritimibacter alkaliphilus]MBY6089070.1 efflux RND transporter periplasmic adaptor subunit [Maritimibacter alkaliphilus]
MKLLRILLGVVLLAGASYAGFKLTDQMQAATSPAAQGPRGPRGPVRVVTEPVQQQTFVETVEAVGSTRARQSVTLQPSAGGRIVQVHITPGQEVRQDDLLLELEDAEAHASLAAAEATVSEAQAAFDRQQRLEQSGSSSEASLQAARATLLRAQAERDLALATLSDRDLRAPFDGVVGLTDVSPGQIVTTTTEIATLDDLSVVEVAFNVPERYLSRLAPGQAVSFTTPAWADEAFEGRISALDTRVDPSTRSIALRAEVPNGDRRLRPGMFMQAALELSRREGLAVPERALTSAGTQSFIHVVEGDTARRVEVVTGMQRGTLIEVTGDLAEGMPVIVTNLHSVSDGTQVVAAEGMQAASLTRVSP